MTDPRPNGEPPVFVDPSGRRRRRVVLAGRAGLLAFAGAALVALVGLAGDASLPLLGLPEAPSTRTPAPTRDSAAPSVPVPVPLVRRATPEAAEVVRRVTRPVETRPAARTQPTPTLQPTPTPAVQPTRSAPPTEAVARRASCGRGGPSAPPGRSGDRPKPKTCPSHPGRAR